MYNHNWFELKIKNGKIESKKDISNINNKEGRFNKNNLAKLYLLRDSEFYQYVGTTFQPIKKRLKQGINANGKNGNHGYKWKTKSEIELLVWTFEGFNKMEIESIEAELVFLVRKKYRKWINSQNEIHFNNEFAYGKIIAKEIFEYLESTFSEYQINSNYEKSDIIFNEPLQFGARGDSYLWSEMKAIFNDSEIVGIDKFKNFLNLTFKNITGEEPQLGKKIYLPRYNFGGISSGEIDCDFWLKIGFPLLKEQFKNELKLQPTKK